MSDYQVLSGGRVPVKAWVNGVEFDQNAQSQLRNLASLPFVFKHIAVMPDCHVGVGSTIGTVIPTVKAIIPAAVGVDIGCGMAAVKTDLKANDLPEDLSRLRSLIENYVPHGQAGWVETPGSVIRVWEQNLNNLYTQIMQKYPKIEPKSHPSSQLGSLGGGNHFIEICLDEEDSVWVMLHSGSRGIGNRIGTHFIAEARAEMEKHFISLPDKDLAYLAERTKQFNDYMEALMWAQSFASLNRDVMMLHVFSAFMEFMGRPVGKLEEAIKCHHNYVSIENHFGTNVMVTRKGAVSAREGQLGLIPGSMGIGSYVVRGKGNAESFNSCSHGAGRRMSRGVAKEQITVEDHIKATQGVECRKDAGVLDESPAAYKDLNAVMKAQESLVDVLHKLTPLVCVKG